MTDQSSTGSGARQRRAAEIRAEEERRQAAKHQPSPGQSEDQQSPPSTEEPAVQAAEAASEQPAEPVGTGPVGEGEYVARDGDCISSIAKDSGHFWETIWNDSANSELKSIRENPNVLLAGDRVTIPELKLKQEPGATEKRHRFRRKGEPAMLRLRLVQEPDRSEEIYEQQPQTGGSTDPNILVAGDPEEQFDPVEDEPRANVPYVLDIDGERTEGTTDADGRLEAPMPGSARRGKLILNPGTEEEEEMTLQLGQVGPITELSGVKERLANLTFHCGSFDDEETPELETALRAFQAKHGLETTGRADQATRDKLLEVHGC